MENGSRDMQLQAHLLMSKILLKTAHLNLKEEEESKTGSDGEFKIPFYSQATKYLKQALLDSLALSKLAELREALYLLSLIYHQIKSNEPK
jgi:hypothetical protein